ncbi:MAG TPA: hypothetical protein VFP84_07500 [Kofleriaceae bacterium]|nr:hypothetical protein [Kofleriaceae bacterium]
MIGVRSLLASLGAAELAGVTLGIERAVARSFAADRARITATEVGRRFDLCLCMVAHLRGDLGWGLQRILDRLPHYLRCELDGQPWEPDRRTLWMPEDGQ